MTNTTPAPQKKSGKLFAVIALILSLAGLDYWRFNFILGTEVTVTDSTIVVQPAVDTLGPRPNPFDSIKADTTKK